MKDLNILNSNKINKLTILFLFLFATLTFSSCSVMMAARKEGTNVENIQAARSRGQIIAQGASIVSSERCSSGELIEVYQFKKEQGSAARAFMHGLLDVSTFGLWEVIGTPVEVCMTEDKSFVIKVYYDYQENIKKIELL
ncbi:MAG: hypothetical protein Q8K60_05385 [Parachlamydiaceae bacterium]|nr:hypothetical protein [Parachlamydiaceae bacterium]